MPLLWRDRVIGWANLSIKNDELSYSLGFTGDNAPEDRKFKRELEAELDRVREFLRLRINSTNTPYTPSGK